MPRTFILVATLALAAIGGRELVAQATHVVELRADTVEGIYRFAPPVVSAHAGDAIVFKVVNGVPHGIAFEAADLSPQAHAALNAALPRRSGDLTGPLLTVAGSEYRVVVPNIPPGRYRFFCLPHRAYDERGEIRVQ